MQTSETLAGINIASNGQGNCGVGTVIIAGETMLLAILGIVLVPIYGVMHTRMLHRLCRVMTAMTGSGVFQGSMPRTV